MSNTPSHPSNLAPVLVWFRQDLRLADNPALSAAHETGAPMIPLYILDDETPGAWAPGGASRWWLHHSLTALGKALNDSGSKLILRRGTAHLILTELRESHSIKTLFWNRQYESFAVERDKQLKADLQEAGVEVKSLNGSLLFEPWEVTTKAGDPPKTFSSFWRNALAGAEIAQPLPAPRALAAPESWPASDSLGRWDLLPTKPNWGHGFEPHWTPGEDGARERLAGFLDDVAATYHEARDRPDIDGTSRLSPHLHFGEISPRTIWHATHHAVDADKLPQKPGDKFLSEIGWREFSYSLLFHNPALPTEPLQERFANFPWADDPEGFKAWTRGQTGYPIVDAGMRELWQTGYMHNRVRMIVASFLTKDLLIPWQEGEKWFWDTLVDADLANNAASWQWVSGCGADAAPYFRIFNPVLQGEKFDPDGTYVRTYVPELSEMPAKYIHKPWETPDVILRESGVVLGKTYPKPVVDHGKARDRALSAFQKIKST